MACQSHPLKNKITHKTVSSFSPLKAGITLGTLLDTVKSSGKWLGARLPVYLSAS